MIAFSKKLFFLLLLVGFQTCFSQNDCIQAIVSCGNSSFNNLPVQGAGIPEIDALNSCSGGEFNSLWIKVTIKTPGTLGFLITPENNSLDTDFDFYVFGPDVTCNNLGSSIRCSTTNPAASNSSSNLTGMNDTETDVSEGPAQFGNNFVNWLDVNVDETYYIVIDRAVGNGNFSLTWTGTATFSDPPVMNNDTALDLDRCDSDPVADGLTEFDLTQNESLAIFNQLNVTATYYTSESDASVGLNPIASPTNFRNTVNPQKVYIRLDNTISGCFTIAPFELRVMPFNFDDLDDLAECDNDNDGFATFNLLAVRNILNTSSNYVISFHHTNNPSDTVNLPDNYTNQVASTNEIIWARIYNSVQGCTAYKSFNIIINPTPAAIPSQITQCDFGVFPDGLTTFNLTQANSSLTNGDNSMATEFYLNATDAANSQNKQNALLFNNTSNPQILTVKVINPNTNCYSLTQLTLNVSVNPTTTVTLQNCDDSVEDGTTTFNLVDAGFEVNGNTVVYYNSSNDALLEQNPITANQFSNQDVYARVENNNDCVGIHIIRLEVLPLPQVSIETEGVLCANQTNRSVTLNAIVASSGNYQFSWSPNRATSQNITIFQPDDYTVTVTNVATGCMQTATAHVEASQAPIVQTLNVVDLVQVNSITVMVSGNGDYWYSLDDGIYQQSNFFDNVLPGQHTVSIQDNNGCGTVEQTVFVLGIPKYFTPNGDGFQDYWQIRGLDPKISAPIKIYIFNRYGKLLKQMSALGEGWDGTYNGKLLPGDDYWYSIQFTDGRSAKGHFTLKR